MRKLLILGDSFSDDKVRYSSDTSYIDYLKNDFTITNFSSVGVGPQYLIDKLTKLDVKYDFLFFILPDCERIEFEQFKHCNPYPSVAIPTSLWHNKEVSDDDLGVYNVSEINNLFGALQESNLFKILPTLYAQYVLSYTNKFKKILLWPACDPLPYINLFDNTHVVRTTLNRIKMDEQTTVEHNNHLSPVNHYIMYKYIRDSFIEGFRDLPEFKTNVNPKDSSPENLL